jgi:histone-lysine N-methyltransferase SETMAR
MMIIFWDKDGVLLIDYLLFGNMTNDSCYASIFERLRAVILRKRRDKLRHGVLLLHEHIPAHRYTIVQANIRQTDFVELNHSVYSPDIAPSDYHLFSNFKKILRGKKLSSDDEAVSHNC